MIRLQKGKVYWRRRPAVGLLSPRPIDLPQQIDCDCEPCDLQTRGDQLVRLGRHAQYVSSVRALGTKGTPIPRLVLCRCSSNSLPRPSNSGHQSASEDGYPRGFLSTMPVPVAAKSECSLRLSVVACVPIPPCICPICPASNGADHGAQPNEVARGPVNDAQSPTTYFPVASTMSGFQVLLGPRTFNPHPTRYCCQLHKTDIPRPSGLAL
jgi:hypothetical protein